MRTLFFTSFLATLLLRAAFAIAATAYVPNEGSATNSVIDTATGKVTDTLRFGKKARGMAISADGSRLYLSDQSGALVVVDSAKREVVVTLPPGESPDAIYLSPDGKWLWAAIEKNDSVAIVDGMTLKWTVASR